MLNRIASLGVRFFSVEARIEIAQVREKSHFSFEDYPATRLLLARYGHITIDLSFGKKMYYSVGFQASYYKDVIR